MNYYLSLESIPNQALNVTVVDYSLQTNLLSAAPRMRRKWPCG
jgi:hypothetical protein